MLKYGLIFLLGAGWCLALTPVARWLALRIGAVDVPGERRIHRQTTARFGGLAIFASMIVGALLAASIDPFVAGALLPHSRQALVLVAGVSAILVIGIVDDLRGLGAPLKLVLEIAIAIAIAACGYRIESLGGVSLGWIEVPVTVAWLVAVTNAFNMIDGLDGLAAGVGAMVTATLFLLSLYLGNVGAALILALLGGALLGFLPYNFFPARIFLGDSGSLFVGFVLALTAVVTSNKLSTFVAVLVPVLALGLPIAELIVTTLRRMLRVLMVRSTSKEERYRFHMLGRPRLFTADRDHIHHRLLSRGLTQRSAVLILYGGCLSLCAGAFGLVVLRAPGQAFLTSAVGVASIVGISRLGYKEFRPLRNGLLLPVFDSAVFARRLVQALLDLGFIVIAFVGAYLIEHQGSPDARDQGRVERICTAGSDSADRILWHHSSLSPPLPLRRGRRSACRSQGACAGGDRERGRDRSCRAPVGRALSGPRSDHHRRVPACDHGPRGASRLPGAGPSFQKRTPGGIARVDPRNRQRGHPGFCRDQEQPVVEHDSGWIR